MAWYCAALHFVRSNRSRRNRSFAAWQRLRTNAREKAHGKTQNVARGKRKGSDDVCLGGQEQRSCSHPNQSRDGIGSSRTSAKETSTSRSDRHATSGASIAGTSSELLTRFAYVCWFSPRRYRTAAVSGECVGFTARSSGLQFAATTSGFTRSSQYSMTRCFNPLTLQRFNVSTL